MDVSVNQSGTDEFALDINLLNTIVEMCLILSVQRGDFTLFHFDSVLAIHELALCGINHGGIDQVEAIMGGCDPRLDSELLESG